MLKIKLITIGKVKEKYIVDGVKEYIKRMSGYCKIEQIELKEESVDSVDALKIEEDRVVKEIEKVDYSIALAIKGKQLCSEEFSLKIEQLMINGVSSIAFIIGSSHGLSENVYSRVDFKMSISKMTFPHQLFKLLFVEQLYRAFKIMKNESYHK